MCEPNLKDFLNAVKCITDLEIILPTSKKYDESRKISNQLFDYKPAAIAICKTEEHVQKVYNELIKFGIKFRVKSGGHNHEGYSSADGVVIIDVSGLKTLNIIDLKSEIPLGENQPINAVAKIGTGNRFGDLYSKVQQQGYIISGGGCGSVAIGGFATGGGWGPYCRYLGMGYDNILGAEILLPSGEIAKIYDEKLKDTHLECVLKKLGYVVDQTSQCGKVIKLLPALRGGGGGNFGVVLNWIYRVEKMPIAISTFTLNYVGVEDDDKLRELILKWIEFTRKSDERITTYARVPVAEPGSTSVRFLMGGNFLGHTTELEEKLKKCGLLVPKYNITIEYKTQDYSDDKKVNLAEGNKFDIEPIDLTNHQVYSSSMIEHIDDFYVNRVDNHSDLDERPLAPKSTCDAPHPHKVSSTFPKHNVSNELNCYNKLIDALIKYCKDTTYSKNVNKYFSLHGMGRATIKPYFDNSYRYSNKDFIIQAQCWWSSNKDLDFNTENINWIKGGMIALKEYTEGAFINFIDHSIDMGICKVIPTKEDILSVYYGKEQLDRLKMVKRKVDAGNQFDFKLSIPM